MKTIALCSRDPEVLAVLAQARDEDIVVQLDDGTEFFVAAIDDFDREVAATRKNEKLMAFLDRRAAQQSTVSLAEVKRQLGLD